MGEGGASLRETSVFRSSMHIETKKRSCDTVSAAVHIEKPVKGQTTGIMVISSTIIRS
jgi:hypothetical protein